jgi:hypothetical protein
MSVQALLIILPELFESKNDITENMILRLILLKIVEEDRMAPKMNEIILTTIINNSNSRRYMNAMKNPPDLSVA